MTASLLTYWFGPPAESDGAERTRRLWAHEDAAAEPAPIAAVPDVVERIRAGDREAFEQLFHTYHPRLWVYARRRCVSDDEASDVIQDVFAGLWSTRERWTVRASVKAYLFGAVQRRILHLHRHDNVVSRVEAESVAAGATLGMGAVAAEADASVQARELAATIARAVLALPERQRTALALWWRDDMTSPEIAEVLNVSPQAVRKLLGKAWDHLRVALEHVR